MKKRTRTVTSKTRRTDRQGGLGWKFYSLASVCLVALAAGFFLAARNHFSSVTTAFGNSELRKQLNDLEAEKRRLMLAKEVALSPLEIKKSARKLGFEPMTAANVGSYKSANAELAKRSANPADSPSIAGKTVAALSPTGGKESGSRISKTASSRRTTERN